MLEYVVHRIASFLQKTQLALRFYLLFKAKNHPNLMKRNLNALLSLSILGLLSIIVTGCPVGVAYPFCEESQLEKVDPKLLGTWSSLSDAADILEVNITQQDDVTYSIEVLESGELYLADDTKFFGWTSTLDGHTFLFSQGAESGTTDYFLYHLAFDGDNLIIRDVGLLVGGLDAVTSTETFRKEVSASLKDPDCLTSPFEYIKQ